MQTFSRARWLVIFNANGTNVSACHLRGQSMALPLVIDHIFYWHDAASEDEAAYLSAVLNCPFVDKAIKPFQATGLMGERHIHMKPLELPIPAFDADDRIHAELSALGKQAAAEAAALVAEAGTTFPNTLAARRKYIRDNLKPLRKQMNRLVKGLLA